MIKDFEIIKKIGLLLAKNYSKDILRLLYLYQNVSASEMASRLNLHIKTAQEFLEAFSEAGIVSKKEVSESKRPYFRYTLEKNRINLSLELNNLFGNEKNNSNSKRYREKKRANVLFNTARNKLYFSSIIVWSGKGRSRNEQKINLTSAQGKFLFNLPFPDALPLSVNEIMNASEISQEYLPEIVDIIELLKDYEVLEEI